MLIKILLGEMTTCEIQSRISSDTVAIIPVGATEQHGDHLPLDFDTFTVTEIAKEAAKRVAIRVPVLLLPTVPFGCSQHHMAFCGTITLDYGTFIDVIFQIGTSLIQHGIKHLLLLNGHGGNTAALNVAANRLQHNTENIIVVLANYWDLCLETIEKLRETDTGGMGHAGEFETSLGLYLRPQLVVEEKFKTACVKPRIRSETLDLVKKGKVMMPWSAHEVNKYGIIGDPLKSSTAKGREFFEAAVTGVVNLIDDIKKLQPQNGVY
jgi:creatinine amidohydrolase